MKIGVAFASSKLGNEIIINLLQFTHKRNIIALVKSPQQYLNSGLIVKEFNFDADTNLVKSLKNIDVLVFLSENKKASKFESENKILVKACKENNIQHLIFCSKISNFTNKKEHAHYLNALNKLEADLTNQKLGYSIVRINRFIDDVLELLPQNNSNAHISNIGTNGLCGYTSVSEAAFMIAKKVFHLENPAEILQISGEMVSPEKLLNYINLIFKTHYQLNLEKIDDISNAIDKGVFEVDSDFYSVSNKKHKPLLDIIKTYYELHRPLVISEFKPLKTTKTPN